MMTQSTSLARIGSAALGLLLVALSGCAGTASTAARLQALLDRLDAQTRQLEAQERGLAERDAVIAALGRRMARLEGDGAANGVPADLALPPARVASARPPASAAQLPEGPPPGTIEVDVLAAERALERTLAAEGVLLVPRGFVEVEPFFGYARREQDETTLVRLNGDLVALPREVKRNEFDTGLRARIGLPLDAQLELAFPFRFIHRTQDDPFATRSDTAQTIGDLEIGLAKTLFRERGWRPDLIARASWSAATGRRVHRGVGTGVGFHQIRGSLVALKRQDPLAFSGSVFYETSLARGGIKPGDQFGFGLRTSLAASPETSLSLGINQTFARRTQVGGTAVPGSDQVSSTFVFGASSILGRGVLVSLSGGIGLTKDAPKYFVSLSVPIRFGVPNLLGSLTR